MIWWVFLVAVVAGGLFFVFKLRTLRTLTAPQRSGSAHLRRSRTFDPLRSRLHHLDIAPRRWSCLSTPGDPPNLIGPEHPVAALVENQNRMGFSLVCMILGARIGELEMLVKITAFEAGSVNPGACKEMSGKEMSDYGR